LAAELVSGQEKIAVRVGLLEARAKVDVTREEAGVDFVIERWLL